MIKLEQAKFDSHNVKGWFIHIHNNNSPIYLSLQDMEDVLQLITDELEKHYDDRMNNIARNGNNGEHYD